MTYFYGSFFEWSNIRNIVIDQDGLKYIAPTKKKTERLRKQKNLLNIQTLFSERRGGRGTGGNYYQKTYFLSSGIVSGSKSVSLSNGNP